MEDSVVCPNCGETNPADLPYCLQCQWRLKPLDSDWGTAEGRDGSLKSGPQGRQEEPSNIPEWLRAMRNESEDETAPGEMLAQDVAVPPGPDAADDLLAGLSRQDHLEEEIPDWVARIMGISDAGDSRSAQPPPEVSPGAVVAPPAAPEPSQAEDLNVSREDELDSYGFAPLTIDSESSTRDAASQLQSRQTASGTESSEIDEWLRQLDAAPTPLARQGEWAPSESSVDVPNWVESMMGVPSTATHDPRDWQDTLPRWLKEPGDGEQAGVDRPAAFGTAPAAPPPGITDSTAVQSPSQESVPAQTSPQHGSESIPSFAAEDIHQLDADAIFASMQMPSWISELDSSRPAAAQEPLASISDEEPILPVDLPSWVEAMRPVESIVATQPERTQDLPLEAAGPLLGLHGVLPAVPGAAVLSGRPRSQSLRLEASERHRTHARLLADMLQAETQPLPAQGAAALKSQRSLRWTIGALMVLVVGAVVLSGSGIFPMPAAVPIESIAAVQAVQSLPPNAVVLAVFDYEPSTVGEMEASGASLMDHLLLLKHPRLALISTSPTGSALAERFMSQVLADRNYVRGTQYVNLGYVPGGLAGVQAFARDPDGVLPLGATSDRVWESGPLLGTADFADFAATIVLTDSLENGRVWIEQTHDVRGSNLLVLISSAQAGPMLLPYFDSGQANGLIAGLNGAVGAEMANGGHPGSVRRYWDAYSVGLYLAVLLMTGGALWQLVLRPREAEIS